MKSYRLEQLLLFGLLMAAFLCRLPFRATMPYGLDSIQYVLALNQYDVRIHQPHPPGYYLFIMTGRLFQSVFQDPNLGFVAMNIAFSLATLWVLFLLARDVFAVRSAFVSCFLLAASPTFWFHSEVALSNMADCFLVTLLAFLCWRNICGNHQFTTISAVILGIAGGFRQNTLAFMFPLWLISAWGAGLRRSLLAALLLASTVLAWYLPMAQQSGGLGAYQAALTDHWLNSNWHGFTLAWVPFNLVCVGYFLLLGTGLGVFFLFLGLLFLFEKHNLRALLQERRFRFFAAWLIPPLSFFVFIYSHPVQTGHSLIYLPALALLLPASVKLCLKELARVFGVKRKRKFGVGIADLAGAELGLALALVGSYAFTFLGMGTAVSQGSIRKYETRVQEMSALIRASCPSSQTLLMNFEFMFLGFREFMYHLPEYRTYQPRLYSLSGKSLLFAGSGGQTSLVDSIEIPSSVNSFILNAAELLSAPNMINGMDLRRFPSQDFLTAPQGVNLFRGDVRDLPKFFPGIRFRYQDAAMTSDLPH